MVYLKEKLLLVLIPFLFISCTSKVNIKTINPASVSDTAVKKISIERFKNDNISLSKNIQIKLNAVHFNGNKYFSVVSRDNLSSVLKEQKLQDSGLVKIDPNKELGLEDVNSILSGEVNDRVHLKKYYFVTRINRNKCLRYKLNKNGKKYCYAYYKYRMRCIKEEFTIDANLDIKKVYNGTNILNRNYTKTRTYNTCQDSRIRRPVPSNVYSLLSEDIANSFVSLLTPSYSYKKVVIIDDYDIKYTDKQKALLKNSIKLLKSRHNENANKLLEQLVFLTQEKSSTALYNYALTFESLGDLENALHYYKKASLVNASQDINDIIQHAPSRVSRNLRNKNTATKQINSK